MNMQGFLVMVQCVIAAHAVSLGGPTAHQEVTVGASGDMFVRKQEEFAANNIDFTTGAQATGGTMMSSLASSAAIVDSNGDIIHIRSGDGNGDKMDGTGTGMLEAGRDSPAANEDLTGTQKVAQIEDLPETVGTLNADIITLKAATTAHETATTEWAETKGQLDQALAKVESSRDEADKARVESNTASSNANSAWAAAIDTAAEAIDGATALGSPHVSD